MYVIDKTRVDSLNSFARPTSSMKLLKKYPLCASIIRDVTIRFRSIVTCLCFGMPRAMSQKHHVPFVGLSLMPPAAVCIEQALRQR